MRVFWTEPAGLAFGRLPSAVWDAILRGVDLVSEFPEMYPVRDREPYAVFRFFFFVARWCVSYVLAEGALVILAVFPARRGK